MYGFPVVEALALASLESLSLGMATSTVVAEHLNGLQRVDPVGVEVHAHDGNSRSSIIVHRGHGRLQVFRILASTAQCRDLGGVSANRPQVGLGGGTTDVAHPLVRGANRSSQPTFRATGLSIIVLLCTAALEFRLLNGKACSLSCRGRMNEWWFRSAAFSKARSQCGQ